VSRRWLGRAVLAVWVPLTTVVIASFMVDHVAPLPPLGDPGALSRGIRARFGESARVVHVIAAGCSCTEGLLDHLAARGARPGLGEVVVFSGTPPPRGSRLADHGFALYTLEPSELRRALAVDGAPVLVVRDRGGRVAYAGGYFDVPAAIHARDQRIIAAVERGGDPAALPLYGCAVSPALADERDPLGIRRGLEAWLGR